MDIYVVLGAGGKFLKASARLQGAENIRADYERVNPDGCFTIENAELEDVE
jgi:hypothetical protein